MELNDFFESENEITFVLRKEHEEISDLFRELHSANAADDKAMALSVYSELKELLGSHAHAEESVLYEAMQHIPDLKRNSFEGAQEHALVDSLFAKLDVITPNNMTLWQATVKVLNELVDHHVKEEEGTVFPKVIEHYTTATREKMGSEFIDLQTDLLAGRPRFHSVLSPLLKPGKQTTTQRSI